MAFRQRMIFCLYGLIASVTLFAQEADHPPSAHRTAQFTGQGAQGCLRCHSGPKMQAVIAGAHEDLHSPSSGTSAPACESYHGPGSIHVSRAHGGRGFPPLTTFGRGSEVSPRDEQIDACLACHRDVVGSVDAIEFHRSPHDKNNINCSRCHEIHVETDPITDPLAQANTCYRCHRKQKTDHPRFEDKSIDFDALRCSTCHDVHKVLPDDE